MRRILLLTLLATTAAGGEKALAEIRLKKDPTSKIYGWILDFDRAGLRFQRIGDTRKMRLSWGDIVDEDAIALRRRLGLALGEAEGPRLIDAHRLVFENGAKIEGLLMRVDPLERHWVKTDGIVMPYPGDLVRRVEKVQLEETDVYTPDELYFLRLQERPPKNSREHADLATYLYDIGNFAKARRHYEDAVESNPLLRDEVDPILERIAEYLADAAAAKVFRKAKRRAFMDGDSKGAIRLVESYIEKRPEVKRQGIRLIDEIRDRTSERLARTFTRVKNLEFHRAIRDHLSRRKPGIEEAMAWSLKELPGELEARVRRRLRLSEEEYADLRERDATGSPHWATYWSGTFVIGKRTRGRPSGKGPEGADWWSKYPDVAKRSTYLKAYAAERLELFEVTDIRMTPCERCGGKGQVTKMSFRSVGKAGKHEWLEVCPRCWGNGSDRAVAYR